MDVAFMPFVPEAPAAPAAVPPKGPGQSAAGQGEESGGFGTLFADLVTGGQPTVKDGAKPTADTPADGETAQNTAATGLWNVLALLQPVQLTPNAVPATVPQAAADTTATGAITAVTAAGTTAGDQTATTALPAMMTLATPLADTAQQQTATTGPQSATTAAQQATPQPPQGLPFKVEKQPASVLPPLTATTTQAPVVATQTATPPTAADSAPTPANQAAATAVPVTPAAATAPSQDTAQPPAGQTAVIASMAQPAENTAPPLTATPKAAAKGEAAPATDAAAPATTTATTAPVTATADSETATASDDGTAQTAGNFTPPGQDAAATTSAQNANQAFAAVFDQTAAPTTAKAMDHTAASGQAPAPGPDPYNVAGQIVDHARLISRADNSEMVIRLKPEHLGELTLKIVVDSGAVSATFHTANSEVRAAIEASLPQLKQDMANQGLKVDNVGVYTSLDHFFANDQHHAPQQQQQGPQTVRRYSGEEQFADAVQAVTAPGYQTTGGSGIDYRV